VTYRGPLFLVGQASRPALGQTVAKRPSLMRGVRSLPNATMSRVPSFRLRGRLRRFSDPQPSFHQVTARNSGRHGPQGASQLDRTRPPHRQSLLVIDRGHLDVGNMAVFLYRILQSQARVLKPRYKRPTVIVFAHRRLLHPVDLHPIDTDWNRENVTPLRTFFIAQLTKLHSETLPPASCWRAVVTLHGEWG